MGGFDYYATVDVSLGEIHGMRKREQGGVKWVIIKDILPARDGCIMKAPKSYCVKIRDINCTAPWSCGNSRQNGCTT